MEKDTIYFSGLITAYFAGEASPDEIMQLSEWLMKDESNLELFQSYRKAWMLAGKDAIAKGIDIDSEWNSIAERMSTDMSSASAPIPKERKGLLLAMRSSWKAAAALVLILTSAAALFYLTNRNELTVVSADSGKLVQVLPDGSEVTLHQGATLEYSADFNKDVREVKLDGEAYFVVKHNAAHPFIVSGKEARIEVLGTSFNVNTSAGKDKISVVLTSGRISLYFGAEKSRKVILNPGEIAEISVSDKSIVTNTNADPNYMAWKTGRITFNNTHLRQVVNTLAKVYHADIKLASPDLSRCSLTATFENQSLKQVLNVISVTLGLNITEDNGVILLSGTACN